MKLLEQLLKELGADPSYGITLVPRQCCYVKNVKSVDYFSSEEVRLSCGGLRLTVEGKNMRVGQYFEGDLMLKGDVTGVRIE